MYDLASVSYLNWHQIKLMLTISIFFIFQLAFMQLTFFY